MTINPDHNGHLATQAGYTLPIRVLKSGAGYYIGTFCPNNGPVSRESEEYWPRQYMAEDALRTGKWTQRKAYY